MTRHEHKGLPDVVAQGAREWPYTLTYIAVLLTVWFVLTLIGVM